MKSIVSIIVFLGLILCSSWAISTWIQNAFTGKSALVAQIEVDGKVEVAEINAESKEAIAEIESKTRIKEAELLKETNTHISDNEAETEQYVARQDTIKYNNIVFGIIVMFLIVSICALIIHFEGKLYKIRLNKKHRKHFKESFGVV